MEPKFQPFPNHIVPGIYGDDEKKHPLSDLFKALVMFYFLSFPAVISSKTKDIERV